jgi:predicted transcriptional regulator
MKTRNNKTSTETPIAQGKGDRLSVRLDPPIAERFARVVEASKRSKTSILEECLEEVLPALEKQYSKAA